MSVMVPLVMFGWIPAVVLLFLALPPRRAVLTAFLVAWLFLPVVRYTLPGVPDYTKMSATCLGILLAAAIFDANRIQSFRPHWIDLPMLAWCLCPLASSLTNDLGAYDGLSGVMTHAVSWGFPYYIGRIYFADLDGALDLARAIFIGGIIYVPFCLYEIKMSPQLHNIVYGFYQHDFAQAVRDTGWRPMVFMEHGLMLGMWMSMAALIGFALWRTGAMRSMAGVSAGTLVTVVSVTAILCRSAGANVLLAVGVVTLWSVHWLSTRLIVAVLVITPLAYIGVRSTQLWSGQEMVDLTEMFSAARARSLDFRLANEDILSDKALQQPAFGWGGWGRSRVYDDEGNDISVTDGQWVNVLGYAGLVGLGSLTALILAPACVVVSRVPPRRWQHPAFAAPVVMSLVCILYMIDNLFNAMINPIFVVVIGGLSALAARPLVMPAVAVPDHTDTSPRSVSIAAQSSRGVLRAQAP